MLVCYQKCKIDVRQKLSQKGQYFQKMFYAVIQFKIDQLK